VATLDRQRATPELLLAHALGTLEAADAV